MLKSQAISLNLIESNYIKDFALKDHGNCEVFKILLRESSFIFKN